MVKFRHRFEDFKKFAIRGNVMDLAVGVIVGGAFGKIVSSLVNDIVMPLIGLLLGAVDLKTMKLELRAATLVPKTDALMLQYGSFLQSVVDFLIIALSVYLFIKLIEKLRRKQEEAPTPLLEPTRSEKLLEEIRDLMKERKDVDIKK